MDFGKLYSERTHAMKASEIRELLKLTEKPNIISFAGGLPNPTTFPVQEIEEATHRVLRDHSKSALQYSTTEGVTVLREAVADHLRADGMRVHPDQVLITNGSQQGLDLLGRVFLDKGDTIIVANPTYLGALQSFNYFGAKYASADSDGDGIIPDSVEEVIKRLKQQGIRPKFLYVVSTFANPTGTSISLARRKRLLELAHEHDLLIVEDDPYGKLRFDGDPIPSIHSLDKDEGRVVYLGTFSKILVPGFRLAWSVAPMDVTRKMVISKQSVDLCTAAFTQYIAADLLAGGLIDKHLPQIISLYRGKRDIMLREMGKHFPKEGTRWTNSQGGLFTWAELPKHVNTIQMLEAAVKRDVAYVPGKSFYPDPKEGFNTMRLNFSHPTDEKIKVGVERLGQVMAEWVAKPAKAVPA
ncbi:MAG TPA: PLP-dependent aminotransferase family protein [Candidatus Thermoplasmatota archaeon]|nr:PLP-dependent aminotransferase family protein [Candidatus Thermoplasmatota archaeon]